MDLVYLDSDILGDSYDAKLCRKLFIRYAQDHPPVLIAVAAGWRSGKRSLEQSETSLFFCALFSR